MPKPIWETLRQGGNLDFDLVSSYHTSFYSFNIVKDFKDDYYTPAKEYYAMHMEYYQKYKDRIIGDTVTKIENYTGYSIVYTESGKLYKAANVVIATNFYRRILDPVTTFDFKVKNKTIVFNMIGDSVNLMIAKLIAGNNRIIILSDGFVAGDKLFEHKGRTFTLDQLEFHNVAWKFKYFYGVIIAGCPLWRILSVCGTFKKKGSKVAAILYSFFLRLAKIVCPHTFSIAYPDTIRSYDATFDRVKKRIPFPNGVIIIKYWGIDSYEALFGDNIEESIKKGYLLNDLPFFIDQGIVECYKKTCTPVDRDKKQIVVNGETIPYDFIVDGSSEYPDLPPITIRHTGEPESEYKYVYRDTYLGTEPATLSNIYLLGYTRPSTGGLGNLTEMQCLFIHKMIRDATFRDKIQGSIEQRLKDYNNRYYLSDKVAPSDHLVMYGLFTEDVAQVIGIDIKLSSSRSIKDVLKYFFFPNNAFKYRQTGEYKVEGCDALVEDIYKKHNGFLVLPLWMLSYYLYIFSFGAFFIRLYTNGYIGIPLMVTLLIVMYLFRFMFVYPLTYSQTLFISKYSLLRLTYLIAIAVCSVVLNPLIFIPLICIDFLWSLILRMIDPSKAHLVFNDLKIKRKYVDFFKKYVAAFRNARLSE